MDSRTRPAPPAVADAPAPPALADAPPGALDRLGRLLPGVDAVVRFAYRSALAGAVGAALVVLAAATHTGAEPIGLVVLGALLLIPAAAVALAGWTLADVAALPRQIREAALAVAGREAGGKTPARRSRLARLARSLWAARGLALLTRGGWLKAVGALRFVRLASLPFALGLVGLGALNAVVVAAGVVALFVLLF